MCSEIENIIRKLVINTEIVFKSQQRDEPEPNEGVKSEIALNLFNSNKINFLIKFGKYLNEEHLNYFNQFTELNREPADCDDIRIILNGLKKNLSKKNGQNLLIKNRRYKVLQKLIKDGTYFSDIEMMKRNPLLYDQLVGQYLTDEEKKERDKFEMKENVTLVKILMEGIERDNAELTKTLQQQNEDNQMEESDSDSSDEERPIDEISTSLKNAKPSSLRWGEFESHSIKVTKSKKSIRMITAAERRLLKEEFITTMHENFVDGKDKDFFNYSLVDDDPSYDNHKEMDYDAEDKYFDSEDPEDEIIMKISDDDDDDEDELDIYMNALNQHSAVCDLAKKINEDL